MFLKVQLREVHSLPILSLLRTSATIGEHALIKVPSLANQRFTYLMLKDEYKAYIDIMFIYYYCFKLDEYCKVCLNHGNFASVDMRKFAKFKFPVPPLEIQRENSPRVGLFHITYSRAYSRAYSSEKAI